MQLAVRDFDLRVERCKLSDEVGCEPPAGLADNVPRAHFRKQGFGLCCGQVRLRTTRNELEQEAVDAVDGLHTAVPHGGSYGQTPG